VNNEFKSKWAGENDGEEINWIFQVSRGTFI
jgi:hypothetical protein